MLTLATHCLGTDAARAAALYASVAEAEDVREAWFGLAAARLRLGQAAQSAAALAAALSRHALPAGVEGLADAVCAAAGRAGWCGVASGASVVVRPVGRTASIELLLDGAVLRWRAAMALAGRARQARSLVVRIGGRDAAGSPIDLAAIRQIEGVVACRDGGLEGWAWHPGDPDRDPVIRLTAASGEHRTIRATAQDAGVLGARVLARPRRFRVPAATLARLRGPFTLSGPDGQPLLGSPLDPARLPASIPAGAPTRAVPAGLTGRRRPMGVVMPVAGGGAVTLACLDALRADAPRGTRIVVVDDATPDRALAAALDRLAAGRRIVLIRHATARGFPASANAGLSACAGRDVVLLGSDALLPPEGLARLRAAAYAAPDIGTATPLTNHAALVRYPSSSETAAPLDAGAAVRLDRLAREANGAEIVDIPTGAGFCLYLRGDCLDATGMLRDDVFAQGGGEDADFCLRARHLGWRHVAATGVFVARLDAAATDRPQRLLAERNRALLDHLHPGFDALIAGWTARDGLALSRRRLDEARWRAFRRRDRSGRSTVLLITHDAGGGVERRLEARRAAISAIGGRPVTLRPARAAGDAPAARIEGAGEIDSAGEGWPNLVYALPAELRTLTGRLRALRPARIELHHLLGHHPAILGLLGDLGAPYDVHVHDYAWFCPRIALVGPQRRYCGEPAPDACEACVAESGRAIEEDIPVRALIERSARLLGGAARIVVPSRDAATRMRKHFPSIHAHAEPHEDDAIVLKAPHASPGAHPACRVVTVGAIGVEKGFDVLLDCARDAASRSLPLDFVVVGHTIDDARLIRTGRVFVTGEFTAQEAPDLIRAQRPTLGLLPSVWPETWCFALTDLWRAGLHVAAFDLGAQAERIRASGGRGTLLPLGLPTAEINNALLAAARIRGQQCVV